MTNSQNEPDTDTPNIRLCAMPAQPRGNYVTPARQHHENWDGTIPQLPGRA
jgi:hypothetical protein